MVSIFFTYYQKGSPVPKSKVPKKLAPNETTAELLWEVLRAFEEKCGTSAGPLDAQLITAAYRHVSLLEGRQINPSYVGLARRISVVKGKV